MQTQNERCVYMNLVNLYIAKLHSNMEVRTATAKFVYNPFIFHYQSLLFGCSRVLRNHMWKHSMEFIIFIHKTSGHNKIVKFKISHRHSDVWNLSFKRPFSSDHFQATITPKRGLVAKKRNHFQASFWCDIFVICRCAELKFEFYYSNCFVAAQPLHTLPKHA